MTRTLIRITSETAIYLLKDLITTYQDSGERYSRVRTLLMYLIFLVKARENGWKSVDGSLTISAILIAPATHAERTKGEMFSCKVGYYREGINKINTFSFPIDRHWARVLYKTYETARAKEDEYSIGPIELIAAQDITPLIDIDDMVKRNYGDYT